MNNKKLINGTKVNPIEKGEGIITSILLSPFRLIKKSFKASVEFYRPFKTDNNKTHSHKALFFVAVSTFSTSVGSIIAIAESYNPIYYFLAPLVIFLSFAVPSIAFGTLISRTYILSFRKAFRFIAQVLMLVAIPSSVITFVSQAEGVMTGSMLLTSLVTTILLLTYYFYAVLKLAIETKKEEKEDDLYSEDSFNPDMEEEDIELTKKEQFKIYFFYTVFFLLAIISKPFFTIISTYVESQGISF